MPSHFGLERALEGLHAFAGFADNLNIETVEPRGIQESDVGINFNIKYFCLRAYM